MRAAICTRYGPPSVVEIREVPNPTPKADEVLIRIHATCVNSGDARIRALNVPTGMGPMVRIGFGFTKPRQPILGTDLAGVIEMVGRDVTGFQPGDEVFGSLGLSTGTHAEYVTLPANGAVVPKPAGLTMEESAALIFGGTTALHFLEGDTPLGAGSRILINGASGTVGCASVQLAKALGAHVTAVCSGRNIDLMTSLGADRIIDYNAEDFTSGADRYDIIMDCVGNAPWKRARPRLTERGRLLAISSGLSEMVMAPFVSQKNGQRLVVGVASGNASDLRRLVAMAESGQMKPVIDRTLPFESITEAYDHVDSGRKRGSVVLTLT